MRHSRRRAHEQHSSSLLATTAAAMSADGMLALMNNRELLMGGNVKGSLMSGNNRDADGTIDRVRDPPESLKPLLKKIRRQVDLRNLDLTNVLTEQGGTRYGTMSTQRFNSTIVIMFEQDIIFSEEDLVAIDNAYGTGAPDVHRKDCFEYIAWMDFVEDIGVTDASFMPESMAPPLALTKQPMSQIAMMLDAMDGKVDGAVDEGELYKHRSLMGDKRWG